MEGITPQSVNMATGAVLSMCRNHVGMSFAGRAPPALLLFPGKNSKVIRDLLCGVCVL